MKKQNKTDKEPVLLTTVSSNYQLGLVQSILGKHNIPFLAQDRASGGYMRVYAGGSIFGTDIYVAPENLEEARELIDIFVLDNLEEVPEDELVKEAMEAENAEN